MSHSRASRLSSSEYEAIATSEEASSSSCSPVAAKARAGQSKTIINKNGRKSAARAYRIMIFLQI